MKRLPKARKGVLFDPETPKNAVRVTIGDGK